MNDFNIIVDSGTYKNMKLSDVPNEYITHVIKMKEPIHIYEAIQRLKQRKCVTTIIHKQKIENYMAPLVEDKNNILPVIKRPDDINASMFGIFVEYIVKHSLGIIIFGDVVKCLQTCTNDIVKVIRESCMKPKYDVLDLCVMSFAHSLIKNSYNNDALKLYEYVKQNKTYFEGYIETLKSFPGIIKFNQDDQIIDQITVGSVCGELDVIHDDTIIDIKCRIKDDIVSYTKQLFAYACLCLLAHDKKIKYCKTMNFLTGKIYIMDVQNLTKDIAKTHLKTMGEHCEFHKKIFDQ